MRIVSDSTAMPWTGQGAKRRESSSRPAVFDDGGFIMVALLVGMAVTAVWMGALLPTWRQQIIREKEAELVFRGEAIARAIYLYRQENGQRLPPNLDALVSQRFLRKKYIDPITGEDFLPVAGTTAGIGGQGDLQGGIIGVRSTSNETSIRIYNLQQTYSQWEFNFMLEQSRAGGGPALAAPSQGGPQGGARGGRGGQNGEGVGGRTGGRGNPAAGELPPIPAPGARGRGGTLGGGGGGGALGSGGGGGGRGGGR